MLPDTFFSLDGCADELFERPHLHPIPPPGEISGIRLLRRELENAREAKVVQPCARVIRVEERQPRLPLLLGRLNELALPAAFIVGERLV